MKFQFSFKFDLAPNEGPCGLFIAYTQRSLWQAYAASSPFEDTNLGIALDDRFTWLTGEPGSVARPPPPP